MLNESELSKKFDSFLTKTIILSSKRYYKDEVTRDFKELKIIDDEDYSEYEYRNWTPKKQLNSITLYDRIIENFQGITLNDKKILKGMLCEYFITDANEIHNIPKENINKTYKELLEKI